MPELKPCSEVVACDLDGTLLSINSYKHWLVFVGLISALTLKPGFFKLAFSLYRQRRKGRLSRWEMKRALICHVGKQRLLARLSCGIFNRYLQWFVRSEVAALLERLRCENGATIYLVTAAWEGYCMGFRERYGVADVLATGTEAVKENIGCEKLEALTHHLRGCSSFSITVLTDHHDDLVLAAAADKVYLVAPSRETLKRFESANVSFVHMAC